MTKREKIAGAVLSAIVGAAHDWDHPDYPWRGALIGLGFWLGVLWLDADPELQKAASAAP